MPATNNLISAAQPASDPPILVSVTDTMRLLSIGRTRLYELMAPGGPLNPVKLGARTLIRRIEIEALAAGLPAAEIGTKSAS